jgi:hypothetical protein
MEISDFRAVWINWLNYGVAHLMSVVIHRRSDTAYWSHLQGEGVQDHFYKQSP